MADASNTAGTDELEPEQESSMGGVTYLCGGAWEFYFKAMVDVASMWAALLSLFIIVVLASLERNSRPLLLPLRRPSTIGGSSHAL